MTNKRLVLWAAVTVAVVGLFLSAVIALATSQRVLHADIVELDNSGFHTDLTAGTLTGNSTFTLPPASWIFPVSSGSINYVLRTDGAGTTTWVDTLTTLSAAATAQNGYLTSTDWNTFNGKAPSTRNLAVTAPITGGGTLAADRTFGITQSATAADGYLSSTDWNTFNSKQASGSYITALTGDVTATGPGSAVATLATVTVTKGGTGLTAGTSGGVLAFTGSTTIASSGALTANAVVVGGGAGVVPGVVTNNGTATNKFLTQSNAASPAWATIALADIPGPANTTTSGYLSSTDWTTFNNKVSTSRTINTTAPITGGGDLSADRTIAITQAATAANGYLSSTDWNTFNNKQATISVSAPITLSTATVGITQSATAANGYLSSTDWNTFNGKITNPMTTSGDVIYGGASGAPTRLAGNTTNSTSKVLTSTATAGVANAPTFSQINDTNFFTSGAGATSAGVAGIYTPGATTGVQSGITSIAAGNLGEELSTFKTTLFDQGSPSAGTYYDVTGLTLTLGDTSARIGAYDIHVGYPWGISTNSTGTAYMRIALRSGSSTMIEEAMGGLASGLSSVASAANYGWAGFTVRVYPTASTTYKISIAYSNLSGSPTVTDLYCRADLLSGNGAYIIARRVQ